MVTGVAAIGHCFLWLKMTLFCSCHSIAFFQFSEGLLREHAVVVVVDDVTAVVVADVAVVVSVATLVLFGLVADYVLLAVPQTITSLQPWTTIN